MAKNGNGMFSCSINLGVKLGFELDMRDISIITHIIMLIYLLNQ